jgi:hypothetical protein
MLLCIEMGFCCAFPKHAKTSLSRPNRACAQQQIALLRSLIGDVKRAIARLAAAEGRLLSLRDELFERVRQRGKLRRHKGTGGAWQMDDLATGEFSQARQDGFRPHR